MSNFKVFLAILALSIPLAAAADTIRVPGDQSTIQDGIDAAVDGDTVLVADGTYTGVGNRYIDFGGKAITVKSEKGPGFCVIDCDDSGRGFHFHSGEESDSIVEGFRIQNGFSYTNGGGIYCENASPTITGNVITNNLVSEAGGGIFCLHASPTITNNAITENEAGWDGGGIFCAYSSAEIANNWINDNRTKYWDGGGILMYSDSGYPAVISNNTISGNGAGYRWSSAGYGGGIACSASSPIITGNVITGNYASDNSAESNPAGGGGVYFGASSALFNGNIVSDNIAQGYGGGIYCYSASPTITNNLIQGNLADTYGYYYAGGFGGGIYYRDSPVLSTGNTITENIADTDGGGIYCIESSPTVVDSILWNNSAPLGPQVFLGNPFHPSNFTIRHSCVDGGEAAIFVESGSTLDWGEGMIDADPLFVSGPQGDFYISQLLSGQGTDSPCLNAGSDLAENLCHVMADGVVCMSELTTRTNHRTDVGQVDMGYHHDPDSYDTVSAALTCSPTSGTLPLNVLFSMTLSNNNPDQTRRVAASLEVELGGGGHDIVQWKSGWSNIAAGDSLFRFWMQNIPALSSLIGTNVFTLTAEDVTPIPFNLPPYPPAGDTDTDTCSIVCYPPR